MPYESKIIESSLVVTWSKPELEDVASVVEAAKQLSLRLGKRVKYVAYIPDTLATPERPVRDAMTKSLGVLREYCEDVILVLEGTGFRQSIGRSVLAGIVFVSGKRGQIHICADIDEAAAVAPPAAIAHLRERQAAVAKKP